MMLIAGCATQGGANSTCPIPKATTDQMMSLSFDAFDQDMSGGWRSVVETQGCELRAAQVIEAYMKKNKATIPNNRLGQMNWHLGQIWANAGQTRKAIAAFEASIEPNDFDRHYAQATIAFLKRDRAKFDAARASLAAEPKPQGFEDAVRRFQEKYPTLAPPTWPTNLDVVDKLGRCFDAPYGKAYGGQC
jgi:tetratricopeptide (TPR) repeat protein